MAIRSHFYESNLSERSKITDEDINVDRFNYSTKKELLNEHDENILNLIKIVENIGLNPQSVFLREISTNILQFNEASRQISNNINSCTNKQFSNNYYLEKYRRSASVIHLDRKNHANEQTTQISPNYQSNIFIQLSKPTKMTSDQIDESDLKRNIEKMYGIDDADTISVMSSPSSSINETDDHFKSKKQQGITIREYYPSKEVSSVMLNRSLSSPTLSQQTYHCDEYQQTIHDHPELNNNLQTEYIRKPNPNPVTYKQTVAVRYLVPPTPPPPGPLIIREILPPRLSTPSPIIIKQPNAIPSTPPPLILREAPPTPPPRQEPQVITRVLPPQSAPQRQIIYEQNPQLPPKPQSIIIEKWLPYKPSPPQQVIYQRITNIPATSTFQRCYSPDFVEKPLKRIQIPVHIEREYSSDQFNNEYVSSFNHIPQTVQHYPNTILTMPTIIVNHPPIRRYVTSVVQMSNIQRNTLYQPTILYPFYS